MKINFLLIFLSYAVTAFCQNPGNLDPSFSGDGKAFANFGFNTNWSRAIATDNARVYVAGSAYDGTINRASCAVFNMNGAPDSTFGLNGKVQVPSPLSAPVSDIKIQPDGKILLFSDGPTYLSVSRLNTDGSLDNSWNGSGTMTFNPTAVSDHPERMAIQQDGKILLAGYSDTAMRTMFVARLKADGTFDETYGTDGLFTYLMPTYTGLLSNIALQPDGKALITIRGGIVVDNPALLVRIDTNGLLDTSFNGTGAVTYINQDFMGLTVLDDGEILVSGTVGNLPRVYKFHPDGQPNTTFGGVGYVTGSQSMNSYDLAYRNNKIVIVGSTLLHAPYNFNYAIYAFNADGSVDTGFGANGMATLDLGYVNDQAYRVVFQEDGKLLVTGDFDNWDEFIACRFIGPEENLGSSTPEPMPATFIYPNPCDNYFMLALAPKDGKCEVTVSNTLGQLICKWYIDALYAAQTIEIPLTHASGVYYVNIGYEDGRSETLKLLKR